MNNIDQIPLVQLRPDRSDDTAVKEQISIIQQACEDADPEIIPLVFHECDYNMQKTIARLKAGKFQDDEWQTAKSTNKKKMSNHHNVNDQIVNGCTLSDSERSGSQRTSPTSSLRSGHRQNDRYGYSSSKRTDVRRRGIEPGRNQFNSRPSTRTNPVQKFVSSNPSETSFPLQQSTEDIPQRTSSLVEEYKLTDDRAQSLNFNNSQKIVSTQSSIKRSVPSAIPQVAVLMHPTIQFSSKPIDIQFGDIQWQNSLPVVISPSGESPRGSRNEEEEEEEEEELSSMANTKTQNIHQTLSSNYSSIQHPPTNDTDNQLLEKTTSLLITDVPNVSSANTSHLSDHLKNSLSSDSNQNSSQSQEPVQIPINRLSNTSTPRASEYTSPTSQSIPNNNNNHQQNNNNTNNNINTTTSAFTPVNRFNNYLPTSREYSQTANWNSQPLNYKTMSKAPMNPTGTYSQPSYPLSSQQQQHQQPIFFQPYPYSSLSTGIVQVITPIDHWSSNSFPTLDSYPYAHTNYVTAYNNPRHYHQLPKYDQMSFDKEFFAHYGQQPRSSNTDPSYQQQTSTSSQSTQDTPTNNSKLSPNAATFSQGTPLTNSPSSTAFYPNPMPIPITNYYASISGTSHHDRTFSYSSIDNRDNRNGANNRTNYYHYGQQQQQQARSHNNNISNSTWNGQS